MGTHSRSGAGRPVGSKSGCTLKMITDSCKTLSAEQRKRVVDYATKVAQGVDTIEEPETPLETPETSSDEAQTLRKSKGVRVKFSDWEGSEGIEDDSDSDKTEENVPQPREKPKRKITVEDFAEISDDDFASYALMKGFAKNIITDEELDEIADMCMYMITNCTKLGVKAKSLKSQQNL